MVDDEERLRQRIVLAVDALPVPTLRRRFDASHRAPALPRLSLPPLALAAIAAAIVLVVVVPLVANSTRPASSQPKQQSISDDFSGGINPRVWTAMGAGSGHTVLDVDGVIELTLEADAKPSSPGPDGFMNANLWTQHCVARGDYVVSVDYALVDWPQGHGASFTLGEFPPGSANVRVDQLNGRTQYGASDNRGSASVVTDSRSGSLRLSRQGTHVTASYRNDTSSSWVDLKVNMTSQFDTTFQIFLFATPQTFAGKRVRVTVDNFQLSANQIICQ